MQKKPHSASRAPTGAITNTAPAGIALVPPDTTVQVDALTVHVTPLLSVTVLPCSEATSEANDGAPALWVTDGAFLMAAPAGSATMPTLSALARSSPPPHSNKTIHKFPRQFKVESISTM